MSKKLSPFQRHVIIGIAIRMRGGSASPREIGEATGLDLSTVHNDLVDMEREKTVVRFTNGPHQARQAKSSRFTYKLAETQA